MISNTFRTLKELYSRYEYDRRLHKAVLKWAASTFEDGDMVEFRLPTLTGVWQKQNDYLKPVQSHFELPAYLFYVRGYDEGRHKDYGDEIFVSNFLCIAIKNGLPSYLSLIKEVSQSELPDLFLHIRSVAKNFIISQQAKNYPSSSVAIKGPQIIADVTFWSDGELRGSMIRAADNLREALRISTIESLKDSRFELFSTIEEIEKAKIVLTLISNLRLPLPDPSHIKSEPLLNATYVLNSESKRAWYLPIVYNQLNFKSHNELFTSLKQKANIPESLSVTSYYFALSKAYLEPIKSTFTSTFPQSELSLWKDQINLFGQQAADWLCSIQTASGFMPRSVSPYSSVHLSSPSDIVRLSFVALALGVYAQVAEKNKYTSTADLAGGYVLRMLNDSAIVLKNRILTVAYIFQWALLSREKNSQILLSLVQEIEDAFLKAEYDSLITELQVITSIIEYPELYFRHQKELHKRVQEIFKNLNTNQSYKQTPLAMFAQLYFVLERLSNLFPKEEWANYSLTVALWLKCAQNRDGSFPNSYESTYCYTRGTSKIFEVLSINRINSDECKRTLEWLMTMQYTDMNMYFIKPANQIFFKGALRHDVANADAWIDAVGHVLLGLARTIKRQ